MNQSSMKIEQIKKIDKHEGFVKGISWDPAGKYLASQVSFFIPLLLFELIACM